METENSFNTLFDISYESADAERILPLLQNCIKSSNKETEVLRAIEVGFALKYHSVNDLEEKLFRHACPAAKNIFLTKLNVLENLQPDSNFVSVCFQLLGTCLKIVSFFQQLLDRLQSTSKITISQTGTLLLTSSEILYASFLHCEKSQKVYGVHFDSVTGCLSEFFKKCTDFQDSFSHFLTEKLLFEQSDGKNEGSILSKVLTFFSKSGFVLVNLEIKTTVKVWKTYVSLIEKYFTHLKNEHNIGDTINCLCSEIVSTLQTVFFVDSEDKNINSCKSIKLACFYMKLIIKLCEIFNGVLVGCQKSLLHLLLSLSQCSITNFETLRQGNSNQDVLNQLIAGADPLLSQLISDKEFIKECMTASINLTFVDNRSGELSSLLCMILKKLLHCNKATRSLWFNKNENILQWLFQCASFGQFYQSSNHRLPTISVSGKNTKFADLYEYVLVTICVYLTSVSRDDFYLVERFLIQNILQSNLSAALLAIDAWCLLDRLCQSDICWDQIKKLSLVFQKLKGDNLRMEKCYLESLIFRLKANLNECHKEPFLNLLQSLFYVNLCKRNGLKQNFSLDSKNHFDSHASSECISYLLMEQDYSYLAVDCLKDSLNDCSDGKSLEGSILKLWKFHIEALLALPQSITYLKKITSLSAVIVPVMSSENLLLVLLQIKRLLNAEPQPGVKLHLMRILNCLSVVKIPQGCHQQNIIVTIAEIFQRLLMSEEIFVKQKALESFYSFSHKTSHSEVITLSVYKSSFLKQLITNYFRKEPFVCSVFNVNDYISDLLRIKYQHACEKKPVRVNTSKNLENTNKNLVNIEETVKKWKYCGEEIKKNIEILTESQKKEIKEFSHLIFSLLN